MARSRAHGALAPKVKKLPGPEGGDIVPEELKIFLQQVAAHRLQVVAQEIAQFDFLLAVKFSGRLSRHRGVGEDGGQSLCFHSRVPLPGPHRWPCSYAWRCESGPGHGCLAGLLGDDLR